MTDLPLVLACDGVIQGGRKACPTCPSFLITAGPVDVGNQTRRACGQHLAKVLRAVTPVGGRAEVQVIGRG